jgi:hypothetical protein
VSIPDVQVELEGRPIIVADIVRTSDGALLTPKPSTDTVRILVATPGDIAHVPGRFFGRPVAVPTAEIERAWSPRLFTLDEDRLFAGPDVLVFNPNPAADITATGLDNETVTVFGVVRPFLVSEFETDYDWFDAADYRPAELSRLEHRPVIVASSITRPDRTELVRFSPELALDLAESDIAGRMNQWMEDRPAAAAPPQTTTSQRSATPGASGTSGQDTRRPVRDVSALLVAGRDDVLGRQIVLDRVEIQEVTAADTVVVGPSRVQTVPVRLSAAPSTTPQAGQYARVVGIVRRSPANAAWMTPLYVEAQRFVVVN